MKTLNFILSTGSFFYSGTPKSSQSSPGQNQITVSFFPIPMPLHPIPVPPSDYLDRIKLRSEPKKKVYCYSKAVGENHAHLVAPAQRSEHCASHLSHQKALWKDLMDAGTSTELPGANGALHNLGWQCQPWNIFGHYPKFLLNKLNLKKKWDQEKWRGECHETGLQNYTWRTWRKLSRDFKMGISVFKCIYYFLKLCVSVWYTMY